MIIYIKSTKLAQIFSVSVSGIDASNLLCGRPYGGCSILYRKSLSSVISPLDSNSHRFCGIKMVDSATSYLLISVYMPTDYGASSVSNFWHTLGELEGFIDTQCCDVAMVVGDFNFDFDRDGPLAKHLNDFIIELDLSVCDLSFRDKVKFTYEVLAIPGLIMFCALSLTLPLLLMSLLDTLTVVCLTTTHCVFHLISTLLHFLVLLINLLLIGRTYQTVILISTSL